MSEQLQTAGDGDGGGASGVAAPSYPDDLRALGDTIAGLKMQQASDLLSYLKDEYGIEAPGGSGVETITILHPIIDVIEEPTAFDVMLTGFDPAKKMNVIKELRTATGLGLADSKAAVEGSATTPFKMKESLPKAEADALMKKMVDVGGKIELK